jgi:hypothetical protein
MFRRNWPRLLTRNLQLGGVQFASKIKPENELFKYEAYVEGIDKFILSLNDRRKLQVMDDILLYINPLKKATVKEAADSYAEKYKERVETLNSALSETESEMKSLLLEEAAEVRVINI